MLSIANKEYKFSGDKNANFVFFNIFNKFFLVIYPKFIISGLFIFSPTVIILKFEESLLANCI